MTLQCEVVYTISCRLFLFLDVSIYIYSPSNFVQNNYLYSCVCFCLVFFTFFKSKYENNLNPYQVLLGMNFNITLRFGHLIGFLANTDNLGRELVFSASFFFLRLITGKKVSVLGGWTAIQLISFTGSNLWFENTTYSASSYRNLAALRFHPGF